MSRGDRSNLVAEVNDFIEEFGKQIPGFQPDVFLMTARLADDSREIREFIDAHS